VGSVIYAGVVAGGSPATQLGMALGGWDSGGEERAERAGRVRSQGNGMVWWWWSRGAGACGARALSLRLALPLAAPAPGPKRTRSDAAGPWEWDPPTFG
jgi:hypothetical protein